MPTLDPEDLYHPSEPDGGGQAEGQAQELAANLRAEMPDPYNGIG